MAEGASEVRPGATLVAVWPGMGNVALTAGYYLMSRLRMTETEPLPARDLFDPEFVTIKDGLVLPGSPPAGRIFAGRNTRDGRELIVYLGDAQIPSGTRALCTRLLDVALERGVRDVYTFAALATDLHPTGEPHVLGVATDPAGLDSLRLGGVALLATGQISGLNGIFLSAAAERGLRGIGLLGEISRLTTQFQCPKASREVLRTFASLAGLEIDLAELSRYAESRDRELKDLFERLEKTLAGATPDEPAPEPGPEEAPDAPVEPAVTPEDRNRILELFARAKEDRTISFELKRELDRLGVFKEYEDRFLDLFRESA